MVDSKWWFWRRFWYCRWLVALELRGASMGVPDINLLLCTFRSFHSIGLAWPCRKKSEICEIIKHHETMVHHGPMVSFQIYIALYIAKLLSPSSQASLPRVTGFTSPRIAGRQVCCSTCRYQLRRPSMHSQMPKSCRRLETAFTNSTEARFFCLKEFKVEAEWSWMKLERYENLRWFGDFYVYMPYIKII